MRDDVWLHGTAILRVRVSGGERWRHEAARLLTASDLILPRSPFGSVLFAHSARCSRPTRPPEIQYWGVYGQEDDQFGRITRWSIKTNGKAFAAAIDGGRFEVPPATGHMPQMETPDLVLPRIGS
jgi:hypothetical protein